MMASMAHAESDEGKRFADDALKCWDRPRGLPLSDHIVLSVETDERGYLIDVTAKEYPKTAVGRASVESLRRSLLQCAPYAARAATYDLIIDGSEKNEKSLNPLND